jgi:hypothetical protein
MEFIEEPVLSELCLDRHDFETYLRDEIVIGEPNDDFPESSVSVNQLISAVQRYTTQALAYYFPLDVNSTTNAGLTVQNWVDASFSCHDLEQDLGFKLDKDVRFM